MKIYKNIQI